MQPDPIGYAGGRSLYGYAGQNSLVFFDPLGLDQQWGVSVNGTVAGGWGLGGSIGVGMSIPDGGSFLDWQPFINIQGNAMIGVGLYAGVGIAGNYSKSCGLLPVGFGNDSGLYADGDLGWGPSVGGSVQVNNDGVSNVGFPVAPRIGEGIGVYVGGGGYRNYSLTLPSIGRMLGLR
ncbi:hypothetical protein ACNHKD_03825 [Methylocystis sp. JAN1]|uniref:hypothetical protein n=1 Tax=Methylocystis sp. JAN1 TaxID=3397211 RepID=UPI003FA1E27A